jgi:hypothetical protein
MGVNPAWKSGDDAEVEWRRCFRMKEFIREGRELICGRAQDTNPDTQPYWFDVWEQACGAAWELKFRRAREILQGVSHYDLDNAHAGYFRDVRKGLLGVLAKMETFARNEGVLRLKPSRDGMRDTMDLEALFHHLRGTGRRQFGSPKALYNGLCKRGIEPVVKGTKGGAPSQYDIQKVLEGLKRRPVKRNR